jgi:hypothetical protein
MSDCYQKSAQRLRLADCMQGGQGIYLSQRPIIRAHQMGPYTSAGPALNGYLGAD